jgi:hypothetical protein
MSVLPTISGFGFSLNLFSQFSQPEMKFCSVYMMHVSRTQCCVGSWNFLVNNKNVHIFVHFDHVVITLH